MKRRYFFGVGFVAFALTIFALWMREYLTESSQQRALSKAIARLQSPFACQARFMVSRMDASAPHAVYLAKEYSLELPARQDLASALLKPQKVVEPGVQADGSILDVGGLVGTHVVISWQDDPSTTVIFWSKHCIEVKADGKRLIVDTTAGVSENVVYPQGDR